MSQGLTFQPGRNGTVTRIIHVLRGRQHVGSLRSVCNDRWTFHPGQDFDFSEEDTKVIYSKLVTLRVTDATNRAPATVETPRAGQWTGACPECRRLLKVRPAIPGDITSASLVAHHKFAGVKCPGSGMECLPDPPPPRNR